MNQSRQRHWHLEPTLSDSQPGESFPETWLPWWHRSLAGSENPLLLLEGFSSSPVFTGYPWKGALEILESMLGLEALTAEGKLRQRLTLSPGTCLIVTQLKERFQNVGLRKSELKCRVLVKGSSNSKATPPLPVSCSVLPLCTGGR